MWIPRPKSHLQQAIANLMRGRTCLVVAHRLTTARTADRIVVLNNGVMVETGSHAALMASKGLLLPTLPAARQLKAAQHPGFPTLSAGSTPAIFTIFQCISAFLGTMFSRLHKSCQK
jgi:ABC-type multidrug transport system ATPase subunit